jgi:hypothetical protein
MASSVASPSSTDLMQGTLAVGAGAGITAVALAPLGSRCWVLLAGLLVAGPLSLRRLFRRAADLDPVKGEEQ